MWSYYQTFEPRRLSLVVGTWNTGPTTPRKMTGRRGCSEGFRTSGKIGQLRWVPPKRLDLRAWHGAAAAALAYQWVAGLLWRRW
jgi:hypothetical protein